MKFCQPHWDRLRAEVDKRGLSHLIAKSGEEAAANTVAELEYRTKPRDYDPLMSLHWMISGQALKAGGLYLMSGDYCPLCEAEKNLGPGTAEEWVTGASDAVEQHCKEQGLQG